MSTQTKTSKASSFIQVPLSLIKYLQYESLSSLETNLILYIIEKSLNYTEYNQRRWVEISPSKYAREFKVHRTSVSKALTRISAMGVVESHKKIISDNIEIRSFRIVDFDIIGKKTIEILPSGVEILPHSHEKTNVNNSDDFVDNLEGGCSDALYGHVAMRSTAMWRCALRPCSDALYGHKENDDKFQGVKNLQYILNNINKFLNKLNCFENSYFDLMLNFFKTKRERRNFQITIRTLISNYGLFHTWVSIIYHLSEKTLYFGDYEALKRIVKKNEKVLDNLWEEVSLDIDNLFYEINKFEEECNSKLKEFDFHVSQFLSEKRRLDHRSSKIFFYDSIDDDVIYAFKVSSGDLSSFNKRLMKSINLYFKAKIIGEHELIYDQFLEGL